MAKELKLSNYLYSAIDAGQYERTDTMASILKKLATSIIDECLFLKDEEKIKEFKEKIIQEEKEIQEDIKS
jgi:hypothetical protein